MKSPRRARRGTRIGTRIPPDEVGALTKAAAAEIKFIRYEGHQGQRLNFSVTSVGNLFERATFYVDVSCPNGRTQIQTALETCNVAQQKMLMVIPAGPKTVAGYHTFHSFTRLLEQKVRRADPQATVETVEDMANFR